MVDANIQKLVNKIIEVTDSHVKESSDEAMLSDNWQFIFKEFDDWIVLKVSFGARDGYWTYPMFYPASKIEDKSTKSAVLWG